MNAWRKHLRIAYRATAKRLELRARLAAQSEFNARFFEAAAPKRCELGPCVYVQRGLVLICSACGVGAPLPKHEPTDLQRSRVNITGPR